MDELAQYNTVLTSTNSAIITQIVQLTAYMGEVKAQLKALSSSTTKAKIRYY